MYVTSLFCVTQFFKEVTSFTLFSFKRIPFVQIQKPVSLETGFAIKQDSEWPPALCAGVYIKNQDSSFVVRIRPIPDMKKISPSIPYMNNAFVL